MKYLKRRQKLKRRCAAHQRNFEKRENKLALRGREGNDTPGGSTSTL